MEDQKMKTAMKIDQKFLMPGRFSLYIFAVAILCFFNWVVLNAQVTSTESKVNKQLALALDEADEPELQVQDWMMDFENEYLAVSKEPEIIVEPWMLSFSPANHTASSDESEMGIEPWMVNFEQRCLVVDAEKDIPVSSWMVSPCTWECAARLLARQ
jgi:hypothetical protein